MNLPILSIIIPTYNRADSLERLLEDIDAVLEGQDMRIQVVVADNNSTDATPELLRRYQHSWTTRLKVLTRKVNLGMEGNIASAMAEGDGEYIWMLSDHQRLCVPAARRAIDFMQTHRFDIGHAKLVQWSVALGERDTIYRWDQLSPVQRGALLFSLTNLSTLVFKRTFGESAMKSVFRSCIWGFPHLGVISRIDGATRVVEFEDMSRLPDASGGAKLVHDYDKIPVRFHSSVVCVRTLCHEADLIITLSGFFTRDYRVAFRGDILDLLIQPNVSRRAALRTLCPVLAVNPAGMKAIGLIVLLSILLIPVNLRIKVADAAKAWIIFHRKRRMQARL